jgi:hypothetical protein
MDWPNLIGIATVVAVPTAILLWMMSKLGNDIRASTADSNAKWMAACSRIDQMGSRIDQTQAIIMRMLEKQGR